MPEAPHVPIAIDRLDLPQLDITQFDQHLDRVAEVRRLADQHRFAKVPLGYAVLRYDDVVKVHRDKRSHNGINALLRRSGIDDEGFLARRPNPLLRTEGADHARLRRLVAAAFTPRAIDQLRPFMRERLDRLIDPLASEGETDLVKTVFDAYPVQVIFELLGAPEDDWEMVGEWVRDVFLLYSGSRDDSLDVIIRAHDAMDGYIEELIERRRRTPENRLLDMLIQAEVDGDRLSPSELLNVAESVIMAGTDTTRNQLGLTFAVLLGQPDAMFRLRNEPSLIPTAVAETLRYLPTAGGQPRFIAEDLDLDDVVVPAGTLLFTNFLSTNFDPEIFDSPTDVQLDRSMPGIGHLTFGTGPHVCLGAFLAKAELEEAVRAVTERLCDLELAEPIRWRPYASVGMYGLDRLSVRYTAKRSSSTHV